MSGRPGAGGWIRWALVLLSACSNRHTHVATHSSPAPARTPAPTMSWEGADWLVRPEREREENPERMLDLLAIRPGMTVADIGAGVGFHTLRIARRVGATGHVYATDIQPQMLDRLRNALARERLTNVTTVLAGEDATGLPPMSIDVALMVDVYHELSHPGVFLASVRAALRPDGRLVLVEFRAEDPTLPIHPAHRMTAEGAIAELTAAGYRLEQRDETLPWQHLLVFRLGR